MPLQALCIVPKLLSDSLYHQTLEDQCSLSRASLDSMYYQFSTGFAQSKYDYFC